MADRLVVVGGDAGGMAAATNARRQNKDLEIVALEKGSWTSYSACGIPYLVGGSIPKVEDLVARTPQEFRDRFRIDVRTHHEVTGVDVAAQQVEVHDHDHGRTFKLSYDQLVIGTGARPLRPDLPGIQNEAVHGVQTLEDASHLLAHAEETNCRNVVVVGGGYIGLEIAEAFVDRGTRVTVVEAAANVMRTLDPDMAELVEAAMRRKGIDVRTGVEVTGFEPWGVRTAAGPLLADVVVLGLGVVPNSELAGEAGIELGVRGAIRVDRRQRTSASQVWAAGDCCESYHLVSRRPLHVALGTVANKQARVAGINVGGGYATFPGVVGTAITRICDTEIARTGLNTHEADAAGFEYVAVTIDSTTTAGYLPDPPTVKVKALAERVTGRLIGMQIVGGRGAAKRIDTAAAAITAGMDVQAVLDLDLSYAPPFSPLWDPIQVAARQALKAL